VKAVLSLHLVAAQGNNLHSTPNSDARKSSDCPPVRRTSKTDIVDGGCYSHLKPFFNFNGGFRPNLKNLAKTFIKKITREKITYNKNSLFT
jgi:hypothetical protein